MKLKPHLAALCAAAILATGAVFPASAFAAAFPELVWTYRVKPDIGRENLLFDGEILALSSAENTVHFISAITGKKIWSYGLGAPAALYPAGRGVALAASGRLLHCLSAVESRRMWSAPMKSSDFTDLYFSQETGAAAIVYKDGSAEKISPDGSVSSIKSADIISISADIAKLSRSGNMKFNPEILGPGSELIIRNGCVSFAMADLLEKGWHRCFDTDMAKSAAVVGSRLFVVDAKGGWTALNPANGAVIRTGSLSEIIDMRFWDEKPSAINNYAEAALFSGGGHLFVVGPSAISRINLKTFPGELTIAGEKKTTRPENTMEQALERAIGEWDGRNFTKAVQLLRDIAVGWPDSAASRLFLGMAFSSGGYFDDAISELEHAIEIEPDNPDIAYNLVGNYMIKLYSLDPDKDADRIVELYNLAIAARPDFQMPYIGLAELYMNGRQPEMAVKTLMAAYRGAFFGRGLHDLLLGAYFMSGRREDTLAFADRVIKMFPDSDVAFQLKGKILSAEGKHKEAAAAFKKAPSPSRSGDASIYPRLLAAGSDFFHGNASGFAGNYASAAEILLAYADALPSPEQVQKLIEFQEKLESDRSAAQDKTDIYKDAGIHPKFAGRHIAEIKAESEFKIPALLSAAHFLNRAGKFKESAKVIDRVVKIGRADPDSMSQIGYLYALNNSKSREADAYTAKALEMDPNDPVYMRNRAVVLSKTKRNREALELFKKAIAAKPDTELLRFEYGQALLKAGKKKEAAEQFKLELKRSPDLALAAEALKKTGIK